MELIVKKDKVQIYNFMTSDIHEQKNLLFGSFLGSSCKNTRLSVAVLEEVYISILDKKDITVFATRMH